MKTIHRTTVTVALGLFAACSASIEPPNDGSSPGPSPSGSPSPSASPSPTASPSPSPITCTRLGEGPRLLRRLTARGYDATVRALLGVPSTYGARFAADPVVESQSNHARALVVSPLLADQLRVAAEELAEAAVARLDRLVSCATPEGPRDAACAGRLVRELGRRAFRRPLTTEEATRYDALYAEIARLEAPKAGAEAVIAALLMSPHFLYRAELGAPLGGTRYALDDLELAGAIAYGITGTMPDDTLLGLAERGALSSTAAVVAQVRRLLDGPEARAEAAHFVKEWLELDRLSTVPKDATAFPEVDAALRARLEAATDRRIEHALFGGGASAAGALARLVAEPKQVVDRALAALYQLPFPTSGADAEGFALVDTPTRPGVFGDPAFLLVHARPNASSPVHRGVVVRRRLMCQVLPPPPPGVNAQPARVDPTKSARERYAQHSSDASCRPCHARIDEIGFALEQLDGIGRFRETENGLTIDTRGTVIGLDGRDHAIDGPGTLARVLADSAEVERCFRSEWASTIWGLRARTELGCALDALDAELGATPASTESLLVAALTSRHARERRGPEAASPSPSPSPSPTVSPSPSPTTPPTGAVTVAERVDSDWDTGFCRSVIVTNDTAAAVEWSIETQVPGTINNHWNADREGDGGRVRWRGVSWNARLEPGATASFGYCAAK